MTKYRVKVTEEILVLLIKVLPCYATEKTPKIKKGEKLNYSWNGEDFAWFLLGYPIFRHKSGDLYYWDRIFTDWLRKNYPEELI